MNNKTINKKNRTRRPQRKTGKLKVMLFAGSLFATLAGTQMLNINDAQQAGTAVADVSAISMVEPTANGTIILLSPTGRSTKLELKQISQAVQPQFRVVARSRSSN